MNIGEMGKSGEDMVARFLRKNGYTLVKRNFITRFGEIDIIAESAEYILFVEVKTREDQGLVSASEAVDMHKQKRLRLAAQRFLALYQTDLQPRFDAALVTVYEKPDGRKGYRLHYVKNAF